MLFELLSGMRLVHACTFYDGGGDGGGGGGGIDIGAEFGTSAFESGGIMPGGEMNIGTEFGTTGFESGGITGGGEKGSEIGVDLSGPSVNFSDLPGSNAAEAEGADSYRQSEDTGRATLQRRGGGEGGGIPIPPGQEKKAEEAKLSAQEERTLTREQKRRRKSILGSDEWTIYAPGKQKVLLGE